MKRVSEILGCGLIACCAIASSGKVQGQAPLEGTPPQNKSAEAPDGEKSILAPSAHEASRDRSEDCNCIGRGDPASIKHIEQVLRGPLHSSGLDFTEQPLQDVVSQLQEDYGIPIKLDTRALDENGIQSDSVVSCNLHRISLQAALRLMLHNLDLAYVIEDEALLITTKDAADKKLFTCVYDVRDLAPMSKQARQSGGASAHADYNPLVAAITDCVANDTWSENGGGNAQIRTLQPGLLVISQTAPVHEEIRELLTAIRSMNGADPERSSRAEQKPAAVVGSSSDEVVTRSYLLQLNEGDPNAMRNQVRDLITNALPDEVWSGRLPDGQGVALTVFHDRVVVRQRSDVQEKIKKILADSGVATPSTASSNELGQTGFGGQPGAPGGGEFFGRGMSPNSRGMGQGAAPAGSPGGIGPGGFGRQPTKLPAPGAVPADNPFQ
jgi:hypothetical protein